MSDSLNGTVTVIEPVLTISMSPAEEELDEDDEPEPDWLPRPPAAVAPVPLPGVTVSPGEMLATDTTVPVAGAYRWVWSRVFWAVLSEASALSTDACAEAMSEALVAALTPLDAPPDPPEPPLPPDPPEPPLPPEPPEPPLLPEPPAEPVRFVVVAGAVPELPPVRPCVGPELRDAPPAGVVPVPDGVVCVVLVCVAVVCVGR